MKRRKLVSALVASVLGVLGIFSEAMEAQEAETTQWLSGNDAFPRRCVSMDGRCVEYTKLAASSDLQTGGAQPLLFLRTICIPSSVEVLGAGCFELCESLAFVAFEAGSRLTTIEKNAFQGCSSLRTICIPSSVEILREGCFKSCRSLVVVTFEAGSQVAAIGEHAFQGCSSLRTICIPSSVETFNRECFESCGLAFLTFEGSSQLTDIGAYALHMCPLRAVRIPSSVKTLGAGCLGGCTSLADVSFENGSQLEVIGDEAFSCTGPLGCLYLPSTVRYWGPLAFDGSGVEEIRIGGEPADPVSGIYAGTGIPRNVEIPSTVTELPASCFANCLSLTIVTFEPGSHLTSLPESVFSGSALRFICIPASVQGIEKESFAYCASLSTVTFETGSRLTIIEKEAFLGCSILLTTCIPASVTKIGAWCFKDCKSLSRVTFEMGSQLREIGREALDGSPKARILLPKGKELSARESWQGWKSKSPSAP